jgi:pimeloyl-ACP methyl ester carboxylesterase
VLVGRYLPYAFYLPMKPGPHGVQLTMHGIFQNWDNQTSPGALKVMGEGLDRILVGPTARGPSSWYAGLAERDVLDTVADVEAHYPVDQDKVFAGGYSMGGYGTYQLATDYPDLFAGYMVWVGYVACDAPAPTNCPTGGQLANPLDRIGNLRNLFGTLMYGQADELIHQQPEAVLLAYSQSDVPHIYYAHTAEHVTFLFLDDWRKESAAIASTVRHSNPAHVSYRTDRRFFFPELGLVPDHAYWVSEIRPAAAGYADVDATTHGCGGTLPVVTSAAPGAGTDPVPWVSESRTVTSRRPVAKAALLTMTTKNVASVTVDVKRTCLQSALSYSVTTDGPLQMRLSDGRTVSFTSAGTHVGRLPGPARGSSRPASTSPAVTRGRLPATGGVSYAFTGVLLVLGAAVLVRRIGHRGVPDIHRHK